MALNIPVNLSSEASGLTVLEQSPFPSPLSVVPSSHTTFGLYDNQTPKIYDTWPFSVGHDRFVNSPAPTWWVADDGEGGDDETQNGCSQ
jgi:hypothetical protein